MHRRDFLIGAAALAACSPQEQKAGPPAGANASDPTEVIRPLYARYMTARDDSFPELKDQAPWSAPLRQALIDMEARYQRDMNAPTLEFDPFVNAQEWELRSLSVTTESIVPESHAAVRATFQNGLVQEVVYDLIWEDGGWRVDNMRSGGPPDGWDLRQIATAPATP